MGVCIRCGKETSDASVTTCEANVAVEYPDGSTLPPVSYNPRSMHFPAWFRCPDCNIAPGGRHHANCDQEECPKCGGQLLGCSCFDTEGEKGGMGT